MSLPLPDERAMREQGSRSWWWAVGNLRAQRYNPATLAASILAGGMGFTITSLGGCPCGHSEAEQRGLLAAAQSFRRSQDAR